MSGAQVRLLGSPDWAVAPGLEPQRLAEERSDELLAYLAWAATWVTREELAHLFWPDHGSTDARRNVRKLIFQLRKRGLPPGFDDEGDALRWSATTDVAQLLQAAESGRHDEVIAVCRGPFLQGFGHHATGGFAAWLSNQRVRLSGLWRSSMLSAMSGGSATQRLALAERLMSHDPLDEEATLELIDAQRALGKTRDAEKTIADYEQRLKDELEIEASSVFRRRVTSWQGNGTQSAATSRGGVPPALDAFIGRRKELSELRDLLSQPEVRWITVMGIGGIGKSRLLRETIGTIAAELGYEGVWVGLAEARHAADVSSHIAAALDLALPSQEEATGLITQAIGERHMLLALDNAEHLEGWTEDVEALLTNCPHLKIAVSSRRRLNASGEWLVPLEGLPQPGADSQDLQAASSFDAVVLFDHRARQAGSSFRLAPNIEAVLEIIGMVDGMPLAIELAATWTRLLAPSQIAAELQRSPDLLSDGRGSLMTVFKRSWKMLSPVEQRASVGLSVFSGTFALSQASAVTGLPLSVFASLVDKSMMQTIQDEDGQSRSVRHRLHPLVKHFVLSQADEAELTAFEAIHATCYADWLREQTRNPLDTRATSTIANEWANLEVALRCAAKRGMPTAVQALCQGIATYAWRTNRMSPAVALFDEVLQPLLAADSKREATSSTISSASLLAPLLAEQADLRLRQGRAELAEQLARQGARLAKRAGDTTHLHECLNTLAFALTRLGELEAALRIGESALPSVRRRGNNQVTCRLLNTLGVTLATLERLDEAIVFFEECMALSNPQDMAGRLSDLNGLSRIHFQRGDWATSLRISDEALELARRCDIPLAEQQYLELNRGDTLFELGDLAGSRRVMEDLLAAMRTNPIPNIEATALMGLARVLVSEHDGAAARDTLQRAITLARDLKLVEIVVSCAQHLGHLLAHENGDQHAQYERAAALLCFAAEHASTSRIERNRSVEAIARLPLGPEALQSARHQAAAMSLEDAVRQVFAG